MSLHDLELCTCGHPRHEHGRDGYPARRDRAPGCTGPVPGGGGSAKCPCTGYVEKRRAAPRPPGPPSHFFWRHAADTPIPEPEGCRALLVWERDAECSEASDVLRLDWNRQEHTGGWTGSNVYLIAGARHDDLYWTWADGDPWTRRSPQARTEDKLRHHAKQYGASPARINAMLEARIAERLADPTFPSSLGFSGNHPAPDWKTAGPGPDEYVDDHAACGPECERCADLRKEEGYRERLRAVAEEYGFADVLARWVGGAG